jgi:hypothetical protein
MSTKRKPASDVLLIALASLLIAFFIWYIAKRGDVENFDLTVQIRPDLVPSNIEIVNFNPGSVTVSFQCPKMNDRFISHANFNVVVDLSDIAYAAGVEENRTTTRTLEKSMVQRASGVPQAIIPLRINPGEVRVTARWRLRSAVVQPVMAGVPAENYELVGPVTVTPAEVLLTGSQNALERAPRDEQGRIIVRTKPIDVTGLTEGASGQIELEPPSLLQIFIADSEPHLASDDERLASFNYEIAEKTGQLTFTEAPVGRVTVSAEATPLIDPPLVTVVVTAPVTLLDQIKLEHLVVRAKTPLGADVTKFNSTMAIEAVWSPTAPEAVKQRATLSEPEPNTVRVELSSDEIEN